VNQSNPYLRSTLLAKQTVDRLRREGCSVDEAKRLVGQVVKLAEGEMNRQRGAFDEVGLAGQLKRLPGSPPR